MAQDHTSNDFDWVAAQSTCNAESMFARLQEGAKQDVERRNRLAGRDDEWMFEFHEDDVDRFEVSRVVKSGVSNAAAVVTFERDGRRIHVHGDGVDVEFTTILSLNVAGHCRFIVGEAEYVDWEIRRMGLELLFFEETD